ncbi:MAG: hypothetical protein R3C59_14475 [Planctomycetaceae bacterium]
MRRVCWSATIQAVSLFVFSISVPLLLVGCGGGDGFEKVPLYPASGTLKMDGKPFGPVSLRFEPEEEGGRGFVAQVDENGNIGTVTTYKTGDGAPVGTFKVTVFSSVGASKPFPSMYESKKSTPLKVLIADITGDGANAMDIQLDSKAGKASSNPTTGHLTMEQFNPGVSE